MGKVKDDIVLDDDGYLIFDDSILDKNHIKFKYVLMDTWYATKDIMLYIDNLQKIYYCPLKSNRKVDDSKGVNPYKAVNELT